MGSTRNVEAWTVVSLLVIGALDYFVGLGIAVSLFYAMIVLYEGWNGGYRGATLATLAALAVDLSVNHLRDTLHWPHLESMVKEGVMGCQWLLLGLTGARRRLSMAELAASRDKLHAAQERVETALAQARRVQMGLLSVEQPHFEHIEVAIKFNVALGLGGDFFDLRNRPGCLNLVVADVSGKGPSAALFVAVIRGLLEESYPASDGPAALLTTLQRKLTPLLPDAMFVTCFALEYQQDTGSCRYANAGHDYPFLRRGERIIELASTGMPLGVAPEMPILEQSQTIEPGDVLLVYTDGLVNAPLGDGERLGDEPVKNALLSFDNENLSALPERLFTLSDSLAQETQDDDTVALVLRFGSVTAKPRELTGLRDVVRFDPLPRPLLAGRRPGF